MNHDSLPEARPGFDKARRYRDGSWHREVATLLDGRPAKADLVARKAGRLWQLEVRVRFDGEGQESPLREPVALARTARGGIGKAAFVAFYRGFVSNADGTVSVADKS